MRTHHENTANEVYGEYRWRSFAGTTIHDGTLEECAEAMELDPTEIEWAIEEYGRCDTHFADEPEQGIVCWVPNDGNGWEWPTAEAPTAE